MCTSGHTAAHDTDSSSVRWSGRVLCASAPGRHVLALSLTKVIYIIFITALVHEVYLVYNYCKKDAAWAWTRILLSKKVHTDISSFNALEIELSCVSACQFH